jgi:hypothetical protein
MTNGVEKAQAYNLVPGITVLYGKPGTRKTTIAATWPGKVVVFDFDLGSHRGYGMAEKVLRGEVVIERMPIPSKSLTQRSPMLSGYRELWQVFTDKFVAACESSEVNTVVLDTATLEWALLTGTVLQELQESGSVGRDGKPRQKLIQIEYGEPNRRQRELFNVPKIYQKHLVLTHHETDERDPIMDVSGRPLMDENNIPVSAPNGKKMPDGFKYTVGLADWVIRTTVDEKTPKGLVEKSGDDLDMVGVEEDWFDYQKLAKSLHQMKAIKARAVRS